MSNMSVDDWRSFLEGRIAQERGNDAKALSTFDKLQQKYPGNAHIASSRAFALERLGRSREASASRIAARYAELSGQLSGASDDPVAWVAGLDDLLEQTRAAADGKNVDAFVVAW